MKYTHMQMYECVILQTIKFIMGTQSHLRPFNCAICFGMFFHTGGHTSLVSLF